MGIIWVISGWDMDEIWINMVDILVICGWDLGESWVKASQRSTELGHFTIGRLIPWEITVQIRRTFQSNLGHSFWLLAALFVLHKLYMNFDRILRGGGWSSGLPPVGSR